MSFKSPLSHAIIAQPQMPPMHSKENPSNTGQQPITKQVSSDSAYCEQSTASVVASVTDVTDVVSVTDVTDVVSVTDVTDVVSVTDEDLHSSSVGALQATPMSKHPPRNRH